MRQWVHQLTGDEVQAVIEQAEVPVMVEFGASWCDPCRRQVPVTLQVAVRMGRSAKICAVDIDKNRRLAARLNIHSIPTVIIFVSAVERERFIGLQPTEALVAALKRWAFRLAPAPSESRGA
jgi:thioredoxin 1